MDEHKQTVLRDLEPEVATLKAEHERKQRLWLPSDLICPEMDTMSNAQYTEFQHSLRERTRPIPRLLRAALVLNLLTEKDLPHFLALLREYLPDGPYQDWANIWTAEEQRHGDVLDAYVRLTRLVSIREVELMQYHYVRNGFRPQWQGDPWKILAYTAIQEFATQESHNNLGMQIGEYEPLIGKILQRIAGEEAKHGVFYRILFGKVLERDVNGALQSLSAIITSFAMPGVTIPGFDALAKVQGYLRIFTAMHYAEIVNKLCIFWGIDALQGLSALGEEARGCIQRECKRLTRIAERLVPKSPPEAKFGFLNTC